MGDFLKNFDAYYARLMAYCAASNIKIEYAPEDGDGVYIPTRRKIRLDTDLEGAALIATLLHECGHAMDDSLHSKRLEKMYDRAYPAFYAGKATKRQKRVIVACEFRAWEYGRGVARALKIPLGAWFDRHRAAALRSYRK